MGLFERIGKVFSRPHPLKLPRYETPITAAALDAIFSNCSDYQSRQIYVGGEGSGVVTVCYLDGVVDGSAL